MCPRDRMGRMMRVAIPLSFIVFSGAILVIPV